MYLTSFYRNFFFLCICLPIRILLTYIISLLPINILKIIGYIFFIPVIGWLYLIFKGKKIGFFGGNAWWAPFRLVHSMMYLIFAILSIIGYSRSYFILYFDVIIALLAFIYKFIN